MYYACTVFYTVMNEHLMHTSNSLLYWTSRSIIDGYGEAIHTVNLKNLEENTTLNIGSRKIEKLVHDTPFLYWINRIKKDDVTIERYSLNSTRSNPEVTVIAHLANNVTGTPFYVIFITIDVK